MPTLLLAGSPPAGCDKAFGRFLRLDRRPGFACRARDRSFSSVRSVALRSIGPMRFEILFFGHERMTDFMHDVHRISVHGLLA